MLFTESSQAACEAGTIINQAQRGQTTFPESHSCGKQSRDLNLGVLGSKAHIFCFTWPTCGRVPIRNTAAALFSKINRRILERFLGSSSPLLSGPHHWAPAVWGLVLSGSATLMYLGQMLWPSLSLNFPPENRLQGQCLLGALWNEITHAWSSPCRGQASSVPLQSPPSW